MLETKSLASSEVVSSKTHEECRYTSVQSGMYRHIVRVTFKRISLAVSRPPCARAFGTPFSSLHPPLAPGQPHITRAQSLGIPTDCLGNECVARRGNLCYLLLLSRHNTSLPCGGLAQHHIPAHTYMHHGTCTYSKGVRENYTHG